MAWPATDFLCFLCSSRCGVGESMLRGVELLSKDFFDFPIASLPLVDFSCILTRGICYFYFFLSFRSFTQWLTSFDPNFLPSIWKSPALEKKSGLVILSSEMEQKVSKCDFHESLVSHIGLWAFVCKVLLATHLILPSSNKGLSFRFMHSSKLRIFLNILEKVYSAQLGKFCRNALDFAERVCVEFGGWWSCIVVSHSSSSSLLDPHWPPLALPALAGRASLTQNVLLVS